MSSHSVDSKTQKQASAGAQANDQQLAANAAKNQAFSDQTRQNLFGTYSNGQYSGGQLSPFLDPNSMNDTGQLKGSYLNQYNNASNDLAENAKNSVGTTMQAMANRGMGKSPAGFGADQMRKAYSDAAAGRGNLYTGLATGQHGENVNNFWNATNMLNSNASQTANLSVQGNQAAANNYSNLYGTASQQAPSGWAVAGQTLAQMGQAAATAYACPVEGSLYIMADGSPRAVEDLVVGDRILGIDGEPQTIEEIESAVGPTVRVTTENGFVARNSLTHAFALPHGGFVVATRALGKVIRTALGTSKVASVERVEDGLVFNVITDGSHTYCADGVWALGVGEAERHVSMDDWKRIGLNLAATL